MLDIIYYFNIFGCLTMGMALLLIQTAPQLINPHYRNAKRFLGIASIIVALCNALILYNRVQESVAEIFAMPVLVAAQLQAALFTFIVLILFHSIRLPAKYFATPLPDIVFCGTLSINDTSIS